MGWADGMSVLLGASTPAGLHQGHTGASHSVVKARLADAATAYGRAVHGRKFLRRDVVGMIDFFFILAVCILVWLEGLGILEMISDWIFKRLIR